MSLCMWALLRAGNAGDMPLSMCSRWYVLADVDHTRASNALALNEKLHEVSPSARMLKLVHKLAELELGQHDCARGTGRYLIRPPPYVEHGTQPRLR